MAATWRAAALEQAELVSDRLRRLASSGLHFLNNEFGLDLGVNPDLWPSWVILSAVLVGLLVAVWWVVACGGATRRKRRTGARESSVNVSAAVSATDSGKTPPAKTVRTEEPKKKNKKKASEKQKTQPNGRTVAEPREEIKAVQEIPKQATLPPPQKQQPPPPKQKQQQQQQQQQPPPPQKQQPPPPQQPAPAPPADNKADKAKKSKKKPKPEAKQGQNVSTSDGKEPDEGAWETKVSNREKRQQRRKEKGPGDSGSPVAGDRGGKQTVQPVVIAPISTKKNKESLNTKAEKREAVVTQAPPNWTTISSVNSGGWNEMLKLSPPVSTSDGEKWSGNMKKSGTLRNSEPLNRGQESEGSWAGMDGRIKTERNTVNFMLGLNPTAGDPVIQSAADNGKWENHNAVDSEWSGFNGPGDLSSDWNAPAEEWGNYEGPKAETPAVQETPVSQPPVNVAQLQDSDDDKEKGDPSGSGKSKRKKKKKKKPEDETAVSQVNTEVLPAPVESNTVKPRPHVPQEEPAKQNVVPPASQKKTDQNWEPPKQVQKKKARRET